MDTGPKILAILSDLERIDGESLNDRLTRAIAIVESQQCEISPSLPILGWNFGTAMVRWAASGFRVRTKEEIEPILRICQSCSRLVKDVCTSCGCSCIETEQVMNKIWLASEHCPLGKW